MTPRQAREAKAKKAKAYKEFEDWAIKEIAHTVITSGFTQLSGTIQRIIMQYRMFVITYPEVKDE